MSGLYPQDVSRMKRWGAREQASPLPQVSPPHLKGKFFMIVTLAFSSEFFADEMERSLIERFFRSEMTHTEVAEALNQQPEKISAILGAIFIVALKSSNPLTRLNIFPELSSATPLDVEKAHLIAAGLPEDIADSLLFIICEGAFPAQRCELEFPLWSDK
jgi:hypothetical protein